MVGGQSSVCDIIINNNNNNKKRNDKTIVGCDCDCEVVFCILDDMWVVPFLGVENCWSNCILTWELIMPNLNDSTLGTCHHLSSKYRYRKPSIINVGGLHI